MIDHVGMRTYIWDLGTRIFRKGGDYVGGGVGERYFSGWGREDCRALCEFSNVPDRGEQGCAKMQERVVIY